MSQSPNFESSYLSELKKKKRKEKAKESVFVCTYVQHKITRMHDEEIKK